MTEQKDQKSITSELMIEFHEINDVLDACRKLTLRQALADKHLFLMTLARFQAKGKIELLPTEDDPNQNFTSTRKTCAPVAYGSNMFTPSLI